MFSFLWLSYHYSQSSRKRSFIEGKERLRLGVVEGHNKGIHQARALSFQLLLKSLLDKKRKCYAPTSRERNKPCDKNWEEQTLEPKLCIFDVFCVWRCEIRKILLQKIFGFLWVFSAKQMKEILWRWENLTGLRIYSAIIPTPVSLISKRNWIGHWMQKPCFPWI